MRKDITTATAPEIEESQAHLDELEGQKNKVQEDTLAIAQNKQELEAAFETAKQKLDEELALKRTAHAKEIDEMEQKHRNVEMALSTIESVQTMTKEETGRLESERDVLKGEVVALVETRAKESAEVNRLGILKHNLNESIADARTDYREIEAKIEPLKKEFAIITAALSASNETNASLISDLFKRQQEHDHIAGVIKNLETKADSLTREIHEKKEALPVLNEQLLNIQKEVIEHKAVMAKKEEEINTRNSNAALLEQRVNKNLEHLRGIQDNFTVERLASHGYKKL